jgi:hypothetical protein
VKVAHGLKRETDASVYKKLRRKKVERELGRCSRCKPHSGENSAKPDRSWKGKRRAKWK